MAKRKKAGRGGYVVEARVCDRIVSQPLEKSKAHELKRATKQKIPRAKVKVRRA